MFYAVQALAIRNDAISSKHKGIITYFDREYVKTGKLDKSLSEWLHYAFKFRLKADYGPRAKITPEVVEKTIQQAAEFIAKVREYIDQHEDEFYHA